MVLVTSFSALNHSNEDSINRNTLIDMSLAQLQNVDESSSCYFTPEHILRTPYGF